MDEKPEDGHEINIDEYINQQWGEDDTNQNENKIDNEKVAEQPKINEALLSENKNKKFKAKTEKELQKEKAKNFAKIVAFVFLILFIVFVITLVVRTFYKQNSIENRKQFKDEEKIVEINENPSDYWKKKMQLKFKFMEEDQEKFESEIKQSMLDFENNSELRFSKFQDVLTNSINTIGENVNNQITAVNNAIKQIEKNNSEKELHTNSTIDEIKKELKKVKEENNTKVEVQLPPMKSLSKQNLSNEKLIPKTEVVYEDINIIADSEELKANAIDKTEKKGNETDNNSDENNKITIFSGFIKVISLTSIKGPTGTKASSETHPVRLQTIGELIGANNKKVNLDACYMKSIAKGDITTLRNHLTVKKLYCNGKDKKGEYIIQTNVKGQIYDELDGGLGFPGVLVDSAGKLLSRELSLAVVQGAAQMLDKTENVVFPDIGSLTAKNTSFGQEFTSGAGAGFSKGLDGIIKYWRDILKGYYPFVDSKAARVGQAFIEVEGEWTKKYYDSSFALDGRGSDVSNWESIIN